MSLRKIFISSALLLSTLPALAATTSVSCSTVGDTSGCDACFYETQNLYTRTSTDTTAVRDSVSGMSDIVINSAGSTKVMYEEDMGTINFTRLQTSVDWSLSDSSVSDMFQITSDYLAVAPAS